MICSKCTHHCDPYPRIRHTPTYFHHPIFDGAADPPRHPTKCSATYHSTVFDQTESGQCCRSPSQHPNINEPSNARPVSAGGNSAQKQAPLNVNPSGRWEKAGDFNPISSHANLWYNHDKLHLMREGGSCYQHAISRERKLVELSSTPFYGIQAISRTEVVRPQPIQAPKDNAGLEQPNQNEGQVNKLITLQSNHGQQQPVLAAQVSEIPIKAPVQPQSQPKRQQQPVQQPQKVVTFEKPQKSLSNTLKTTARPATAITGARKAKITTDNVRRPQPVFKSVTRRR